MKNIIETKKLCKTFSNGGIQQHVLKNIDLEVYEGDFKAFKAAASGIYIVKSNAGTAKIKIE